MNPDNQTNQININNQSNLPLSLSKRNLVIIGISFLIIILVLFIISLLVRKSSKTVAVKQEGNSLSQVTPTMAPVNPFPNGGRYQQSTYSIAYPQGSQNSVSVFIGGSTLIEEPPSYPGEPVLDVEAYTSTQNLQQKEALYIATGATKTTLDANGSILPELKNIYQMRTINSKRIHTPTQLRLAYLVKPHAFYVFRMYYSSATEIPADENLFHQFVESFVLK